MTEHALAGASPRRYLRDCETCALRWIVGTASLAASACNLITGVSSLEESSGMDDARADARSDAQADTRGDTFGDAGSDHSVLPPAPTPIATAQGHPIGLVLAPPQAYWVDDVPDGSVMSVAVSGAAEPVVLSGVLLDPFSLGLAPPLIYLACDNDTTAISTLPLDGGPLSIITEGIDVSPRWVATDSAGNFYWTNAADHDVWENTQDGGPTVIVPGLASPAQIAADDSGLYWVDPGNTTVMNATLSGANLSHHFLIMAQKTVE